MCLGWTCSKAVSLLNGEMSSVSNALHAKPDSFLVRQLRVQASTNKHEGFDPCICFGWYIKVYLSGNVRSGIKLI